MIKPDPTNSTSDDADARLIADVIALRADMAGVIKQAERLLETYGVVVESVIANRQQRRYNRQQPYRTGVKRRNDE